MPPATENPAAIAAAPLGEAAPRRWWHFGENFALALLLAIMVLLPLAEIVLRKFSTGIPSAPDFLRHLTLLVGMVGGVVAARDGRLLSLATAPALLRGRWKGFALIFSTGVGAAVTAFLCVASLQFVLQEREAGGALAYDIPLWVIQLAMPAGFGVICLRLLWRAAGTWSRRAFALVLATAFILAAIFPPIAISSLTLPALAALLAATVLGTPIYVALGGAAMILFWGRDVPIAAVSVEHYGLVTNPALPAIPLFTLAGYFMAEGAASQRLIRVFQALFGWFRGGPAIATALICAFFTSFTGGSGVTILALGGLLMPALIAARFSERDALGLVTGAGSLGVLLPPCLPVILYAILAKVDIKEMFVAGLVPAFLLIAMTGAWGVWAGRKATEGGQRFNLREAGRAAWAAKWELMLPVVSIVALFGGWATPVEAAAVTAFYAFIVAVVIHRDLGILRDCPRVMTEAGVLVGGILLILGVALGLTSYMVDAQIPDRLADWAAVHVQSRWVFLLGLNVALLFIGGLVEIYAAIVVVVPLLIPIGARLGIDPLHLGIIFLANMELSFLAPPVGLNLLLASYRLNKPLPEVMRAVLPLLGVRFIGVLLITYIPWISLVLPHALR
ncbi:MAG: TRAP transporter large permease subunit [Opitutaceae bacterium]|nr:TRAP transporter large permease subunit [Opitutaceae bacterium]